MSEASNEAQLQQLRELADALRLAEPAPAPPGLSGRGIVICAGGARIFTNAYVLVRVLRDTVGCWLPIELWHFGLEEISPAMAQIMQELDVTLVDAWPLIEASGVRIRDGWQLKPFALLWSKFKEALLLDADQVPIIDPAALFDWPDYLETGAVFWPDTVRLKPDNAVWRAFGLAHEARPSFESGQVLVDKARHWMPLWTTVRLNAEAELLYRLIYGDKDSFLLGWLLRAAPFSMVPHAPVVDEHYFVQRDFSGRPVFQHRTNAKWNYAGEQSLFSTFVHEGACLSFLAELRERWGGRVFNAPDRSIAARQAEVDLAARAHFVMEVGDGGMVELELRPDGEIGRGRAYDRQNWWVEERDGAICLVIWDGDSRSHELRREDAGYWVGERIFAPAIRLVLKPAGKSGASAKNGRPTITLADQLLDAAGITQPGADFAATLEALALLSRVVPGIGDRLRARAAANAGDPAFAARLAAFADGLLRREAPSVQRPSSDALMTGYVRGDGGALQ